MSASAAVELPVVGDRTPEIEEIISTIRAWLSAITSPSSDRPHPPKHSLRFSGSYQSDALTSYSHPDRHVDLDLVVLVNTLTKKGVTTPGRVTELVRTARVQQPERGVIVVLDEESPEAVRAARDAGAFEFLGTDEIKNVEAVYWRFQNATMLARACARGPEAPARPVRPLVVRKTGRLSAAEIRKADAAIDAAPPLPTAEERRAQGSSLLAIVAPELRDEESGRLDARKIARAMGFSLAALARVSGVTQQALSARPDSPAAQAGLLPVARLSTLLDELFRPEHKRVWLQTPHLRFGDRSPAQAIREGDAGLVVLSVENALEGHPD